MKQLSDVDHLMRENQDLRRMVWSLVEAAGGKVVIPAAVLQEFGPAQYVVRMDNYACNGVVLSTRPSK